MTRTTRVGLVAGVAIIVLLAIGVHHARLDPWRPGTTHTGRAVPTYCGTFEPDRDVLGRGQANSGPSIPWVLDEQIKPGTATTGASIVPRDGTLTVTDDGQGLFVAEDGTRVTFRHSFCPAAHDGP